MNSSSSASRFACIDGFAEELDEIMYDGISNWFVSFRSLFTVYSAHFSYLIVFISIITCGVLSFRHSVGNGKKYTQYWWGALVQGVLSERSLMSTKYWHAQAPVMFFGKQLPLHIVFLYPFMIYVCTMAVQRMQLSICTEPAAIGLLVMLMEIPFRMISVKFLHITYHDTEPLFYHKLCGVPWVEIFSSLLFASSYAAIYHGLKLYHTRELSTIWDKSDPEKKETVLTVISGTISPLVAFVQKLIFFHVFHDFFNVNPISCLFFTICVYLSFILCFEPRKGEKHLTEDSTEKTYLFYQIAVYFACLTFLALFGRPENEVSIGSHEPTGDCTTLICSRTPLGKEIERQKYLCTDDISNRFHFLYTFNCTNGPPCLNAVWYTICGTPFRNRVNFLVLILSLNLFSFSIFMRALFKKLLKRFMNRIRQPIKRKKYLCADEVAARKNFVYNFECLEEGPPCLNAVWYTICGSPIHNKAQFILNILSFVVLLSSIFAKILFAEIKKLDVMKKMIVRFRRPAARHGSVPSQPDEVTVGFVLVQQDRLLSLAPKPYKRKFA